MCLYVKEGCKPEIATKDIVCYKIVDDHVKYWKPAILTASAMFSYPYNKVLTAESYIDGGIYPIQHLNVSVGTSFYVTGIKTIQEGFHASRSKTIIAKRPCIIPKGTEYCLGEDNEIIAVNMIVFRSVLDYYWYRIKKLWQR